MNSSVEEVLGANLSICALNSPEGIDTYNGGGCGGGLGARAGGAGGGIYAEDGGGG